MRDDQHRRSRRLILFDAGLCSQRGHHFNTDLGIVTEAQARGFQTIVFGLKNCNDPEVVEKLHPVPLFRLDVYHSEKISEDEALNALASNEKYYEALRRISFRNIAPDDVLFFHTVHSPNLLGMVRWLEELAEVSRPKVIIEFLYADYLQEFGSSGYKTKIFSEALRRLAEISKLRIDVLAESFYMKERLDSLAEHRLPINIAPFPAGYKELLSEKNGPDRNQSCACRVGIFGRGKDRKGTFLVPEIVTSISRVMEGVNFSVQVDLNKADSQRLAEFRTVLEHNRKVDYFEGPISIAHYVEKLRSCDIILLPYSPAYSVQGSGLCAEAMAIGKVLVAPAYFSQRREIEHFKAGCVYFDHWNATAITSALLHAVSNLEVLTTQARLGASRFKEERGPKRFDKLFDVNSD